MPATDIITGARTVFVWDNIPIGVAAGIAGQEDVEYQPIEVLNQLQVFEYVPVAYRCSFSASMFRRLPRPNVKRKAGGFDVTGTNARNTPGAGLNESVMPSLTNILATEGVNAVARADFGVADLYTFTESKCSSRNFDISVRGAVLENLQFVATRLKTEDEE